MTLVRYHLEPSFGGTDTDSTPSAVNTQHSLLIVGESVVNTCPPLPNEKASHGQKERVALAKQSPLEVGAYWPTTL